MLTQGMQNIHSALELVQKDRCIGAEFSFEQIPHLATVYRFEMPLLHDQLEERVRRAWRRALSEQLNRLELGIGEFRDAANGFQRSNDIGHIRLTEAVYVVAKLLKNPLKFQLLAAGE